MTISIGDDHDLCPDHRNLLLYIYVYITISDIIADYYEGTELFLIYCISIYIISDVDVEETEDLPIVDFKTGLDALAYGEFYTNIHRQTDRQTYPHTEHV
jgi:hypothetical protein